MSFLTGFFKKVSVSVYETSLDGSITKIVHDAGAVNQLSGRTAKYDPANHSEQATPDDVYGAAAARKMGAKSRAMLKLQGNLQNIKAPSSKIDATIRPAYQPIEFWENHSLGGGGSE